MGLAILLLITVAYVVWDIQRERRSREASRADLTSRSITEAAAATDLAPLIDPLIRPGAALYLPVGAGTYLATTVPHLRRRWLGHLRGWLQRGATIHVIVSRPTETARTWTTALRNEFPTSFHVYFLHRERAPQAAADDIRRLDTFHPVILRSEPSSGMMWIEHDHQPDSVIAYNVDYVAPGDVGEDPRFERYLSALLELIDERQPFVETIHAGRRAPMQLKQAA